MTKAKSSLAIYLITGLSALLAVGMVYYYLDRRISDERLTFEQRYATRASEAPQSRVVVMVRDLAEGTIIEPADIRVTEVNSDQVKEMATVSDPSLVVGKRIRQALYTGEWLLSPKLATDEGQRDFSTILADGHRAIRIAVTATNGLLGLVEPRDRVDVIAILPLNDSGEVSRTILQDVPVLAVGSHAPGQTPPKEAETKTGPENAKTTVTLDVSAVEAEKLALAVQAGKIQLVLRNHGDRATRESTLMAVTTLVNSPPRPPSQEAAVPKKEAPKALAPGNKVMVVLGDKIATEVVTR